MPKGLLVLVCDGAHFALSYIHDVLRHHGVNVLLVESEIIAKITFDDYREEIDAICIEAHLNESQATPDTDGLIKHFRGAGFAKPIIGNCTTHQAHLQALGCDYVTDNPDAAANMILFVLGVKPDPRIENAAP